MHSSKPLKNATTEGSDQMNVSNIQVAFLEGV
jgi:hypothetical protein